VKCLARNGGARFSIFNSAYKPQQRGAARADAISSGNGVTARCIAHQRAWRGISGLAWRAARISAASAALRRRARARGAASSKARHGAAASAKAKAPKKAIGGEIFS
jgi:hypothetical protein